MKTTKDLAFKKRLSPTEYNELVEMLVRTAFSEDEGGVIYQPQMMTVFIPSILVGYCMDGIEFETIKDENGNERLENIFSEEFIDQIFENEEVASLVYNVTDYANAGIDKFPPAYIENAIDDAEKIIQSRLESLKPINSVLYAFADVIDAINDALSTVDKDEVKKAISSFVGTINAEVSSNIEQSDKT